MPELVITIVGISKNSAVAGHLNIVVMHIAEASIKMSPPTPVANLNASHCSSVIVKLFPSSLNLLLMFVWELFTTYIS